MSSDVSLFKLEDVSIAVGNGIVLSNINLEVSRGEVVFILGCSGVGKSVLAKAMAGFLPLAEGSCVRNKEVSLLGFHSFGLSIELTLEENARLRSLYLSSIEASKKTLDDFFHFTGLSDYRHLKLGAVPSTLRSRFAASLYMFHKGGVAVMDGGLSLDAGLSDTSVKAIYDTVISNFEAFVFISKKRPKVLSNISKCYELSSAGLRLVLP
ncbi:bicarbonate transport ATP-binding protein CmpD [Pseudomonas sp. SCT]|uniref:ATP-binding cassette domain-containing protein n=1 Tax=Pseudomonas sp. (strain SCT) TaxID=412955 RepID=UPI000EDC6A66|nr:ATP-binding cassette domain-containing protein [Pseudomonas sp. SCT]GCA55490.1 bicarbonate transport ATP-binding protein CmpD [Pseudomonas sp. SCT]